MILFLQATCDGGSYTAAAKYTWDAEDAWVYGDVAFYEKAERIEEEAQALRDEVQLYIYISYFEVLRSTYLRRCYCVVVGNKYVASTASTAVTEI